MIFFKRQGWAETSYTFQCYLLLQNNVTTFHMLALNTAMPIKQPRASNWLSSEKGPQGAAGQASLLPAGAIGLPWRDPTWLWHQPRGAARGSNHSRGRDFPGVSVCSWIAWSLPSCCSLLQDIMSPLCSVLVLQLYLTLVINNTHN